MALHRDLIFGPGLAISGQKTCFLRQATERPCFGKKKPGFLRKATGIKSTFGAARPQGPQSEVAGTRGSATGRSSYRSIWRRGVATSNQPERKNHINKS